MFRLIIFLLIIINHNTIIYSMEKKLPFHHLDDGTFRNPEGSPERDPNVK